jgi:dienelactone hydrolase
VLAGLLLAASAAMAQRAEPPPAAKVPAEPEKLHEDIRETIVKLPVTVTLPGGTKHSGEMVLTHYRPKGDGPFPVVIMNHGRGPDRGEIKRFRSIGSLRYWTRRGFAVFVPTRIGYGDSGAIKLDPEAAGSSCDRRDYGNALRNMLTQIDATLAFARTTGFVDDTRVIVMGQSYGGFASVGASGHPIKGLLGAINFAGGGGGNPKQRPGNPCGPDKLGQAMAGAGGRMKVPMLWLYAENDRYWGAEWPRRWHAAYQKAGGSAELVMFPPVGEDGHKMIGEGFRLWRPHVDRYLAKLGFPPPASQDAPPATAFAPLGAVDKVPHLNEKGREGYARFLDGDLPRAFAISPGGAWSGSWGQSADAPKVVLERCQRSARQACRLYAVDDAVVWTSDVAETGK